MKMPLIPAEILEKADKILFIAHLALGDFTYMQNCFRAFAQAYPHIKIHLWVDELRRTPDANQWDNLKKYSLYDWVNASDLFERVYNQTYSPELYNESIRRAQTEEYPLVVSLAVHHRHKYVNLMRKISANGFIVGQKKRVRFYDIPKHLIYRQLDAFIPAYRISKKQQAGLSYIPHISSIYADWFHQLFNINIRDEDRFPYVDIPPRWHDYARQQFANWHFSAGQRVIFLNGFSKSPERSWPLERVFELAAAMQGCEQWREAGFVINVIPECMQAAQELFARRNLNQVHLFSAQENFFQLPAILSLTQLIISVETAVMHLANAVHVPVVALMRQTSPEWVPINANISTIIRVGQRKDWVEKISVDQVMKVIG